MDVSFVTVRERALTMVAPQAYRVRTDRPAVWLQKACVWVLEKLRAYHETDVVKVERHALRSADFMQRIFEQRRELIRAFDRRPKELLIGAEDYDELMGYLASQPFEFRAQYYSGDYRSPTIYGLTVKVIPWMRGMVVMP